RIPIMLIRVVAVDDGNRAAEATMGDRDAGGSWRCQRGRNAGNNLKRHARPRQRQRLFATSTEDERIAAFQPHHTPTLSPELHQQCVDVVLTGANAAWPL